MSRKLVPKPESEAAQAKAREKHIHTDETVPTTSFVSMNIHGVLIASRHDIDSEYEGMAAMVEAVTPTLRKFISNIRCDSTAMDCYSVILNPCSDKQARLIVAQLEQACNSCYGGHNGITIHSEKNSGSYLDPHRVR